MINIWRNTQLRLQRNIRKHRQKRYRKIGRVSNIHAILRASLILIESWILGEEGKWDLQYAKTESPIERKLYNALSKKGYRIKTQVKCGRYYIDIAIPKYKLAIECDGKRYHSSYKQKEHDHRKNQFLIRYGWHVLRFTGSQINGKMGSVLNKVREAAINREPIYKKIFKKIIR